MKKPAEAGFFMVLGRKPMGLCLGGCEPVSRVKRAAHAQRQGRHVNEEVAGQLVAACARFRSWHGQRVCVVVCLIRPFCLAGLCRTGYRKE